MKTEQEQIEKMARTMCGYCSTDGKCAVSRNWREPDICANVDTQHCLYKEHAEELIENGYGDVSEYKAEIERLKDEIIYLERKIAIRDNALKDSDKAIEMLEGKQDTIVKQAQIDVLNKAKEKFNAISRELGDDCDLCGVSAVCSCRCEINKLIKEVENEQKD